MASTSRLRSASAIRLNSLAALPLIRIEKLTPDLIPVQYRIFRILEPFAGYLKVLKVLKVALDCLTDDFRTAAPETTCNCVQRIDDRIG